MVLTIGYGNVFYDMLALISCIECTCHRARSLRRHFGSRRRAGSVLAVCICTNGMHMHMHVHMQDARPGGVHTAIEKRLLCGACFL